MTSEKLAWHRENDRLLDPKFDRLAVIGDKRKEKEGNRKLSIKYNTRTIDDEKIYLEFTIETPSIKSSTATIFVEEMNSDNEIAVPKTIVTDLKSNSKAVISESGARFVRNKTQQRTFSLDFNYLDSIEEQSIVNMLSETDLSKDILFSAYPETGTSEEQLHTALCFFDGWKGRTRNNLPFRSWGANLVESI
jgi:hypothetical protein